MNAKEYSNFINKYIILQRILMLYVAKNTTVDIIIGTSYVG